MEGGVGKKEKTKKLRKEDRGGKEKGNKKEERKKESDNTEVWGE